MARLGRYFVPDQPLYVIQRGNNRKAIFFADEDYSQYRNWLIEAAEKYGLAMHAYVLMTNHVHPLVTPADAESLPRSAAADRCRAAPARPAQRTPGR
jgi:putative transposase